MDARHTPTVGRLNLADPGDLHAGAHDPAAVQFSTDVKDRGNTRIAATIGTKRGL